MVQLSPIVTGQPGSECTTLPSCTLDPSPTVMGSTSPLNVTLNQMFESFFNSTLPIITELDATQLFGSNLGVWPSKS